MYVGDAAALQDFKNAGNEHVIWTEQDMVEVRNMAKESWAKWGGESPLATKVYESQISFMEQLGLI